MRFTKSILGLILGTLTITQARAALELPSIIGDHMVYQSGKPAVIWGKDQPGQKVTVTLNRQSAKTNADAQGRWKATLPSLAAGGPYEMTVSGSTTILVKDILVGEVWLGSGQSNMEFRMDQTANAAKDIAAATDSQIRLFLQKLVMSPQPLEEPQGEWKVCSPESVKNFSAVAYHFGANLRKDLKVPVGLIAASWGGSYAESWTPENTLRSDPAFKSVWDRWNALPANSRKLWQKGRFGVDLQLKNLRLMPKDPSQAPLTIQAQSVSLTSKDTLQPGVWGMSVKDGSSLSVSLTPEGPHMVGSFLTDAWGFMTTALGPKGQPANLSAYASVEFEAKGDGKYILFLSQPTVVDWDNFRTPDPFPISKQWKKITLPFSGLKQSGWGKPQTFTPQSLLNLSFGVDPKPLIDVPCALYNGMIHPLTPFPVKGVIWYQGEANSIRAGEYAKLLGSMIEGWRQAWKNLEMPFLLAQLPNYVPTAGQGVSQWGELRDQQRQVAEAAHCGMAVLIDLGDSHNIHPTDKADVGYRLEQEALIMPYGVKKVRLSPKFDQAQVEGSKIRVFYKNVEEGLRSIGGDLMGFEVAGEDGAFVSAQAKIEKGSVVVWNDRVPHPLAVRYAWEDDPACNLYGTNGLPASPFMADQLSEVSK